jgi:phosphate transport system substrate-binding protein
MVTRCGVFWRASVAGGLLLLLSAAAGCRQSGVASDVPPPLVVTGSSTLAPLVSEMARRFEQRHPGWRVDVQSGGSSRGIADVRSGLADIGMVSRALKSDESDLQQFAVAHDGICLIVHRDNPVETLTEAQIIDIYRGTIGNWRDVGGNDAPITVVHKAAGRSTLELFVDYFRLDHREVRADVIIGENAQGIKTVAGNPQAIGYVSIGTAEFDRRQGVAIKLLPLQGAAASAEHVADGTYALRRTLVLVTTRPATDTAAQFLAFAQSPDVQDLVEELALVPLR